jgi:Fe-S cluster assembly scaffold protein SufB
MMMSELDRFLKVLDSRGVDRAILHHEQTAHLMVSGNQLLSQRQLAGIEMDSQPTADGIIARIRVLRDVELSRPLHLCFGVLPAEGRQHITTHLVLEDGAKLEVIAHCFFPNAQNVEHLMDALIEVGEKARLSYREGHYHGIHGGISVVPKASVKIGRGGIYQSDFSLTSGRVGRLDIDYEVEADEQAVVELSARVFGHGDDRILIREKVVLAGQAARGLIKTRIAVEDEASAQIVGITEGNAAQVRGHMDCLEIIKDRATASAQPTVRVCHPQAKVTHEAAIGSVDHHQLETLMAHGLSPEEAVDTIVGGLLGQYESASTRQFRSDV